MTNNNQEYQYEYWGKLNPSDVEKKERKAIDNNPIDARAWSSLANSLNWQGRYLEAELACQKAINLQPNNNVIFCDLGYALNRQSRFQEADQAYRESIRLYSEYSYAWSGLGYSLTSQNRFDEAEGAFFEAIDLFPLFTAWNGLGTIYLIQEHYELAEEAFKEAISLNPKDPFSWCNLGEALNKQEQYVEAERASRRSTELNPKYSYSWNHLGDALLGQGDLKEAEKSYGMALDLYPELANALYNLACIKANEMNHEEIIKSLEKVITLDKSTYTDLIRANTAIIKLIPENKLNILLDMGSGDIQTNSNSTPLTKTKPMAPTRAPFVFLCHAQEDKKAVQVVKDKLEKRGISTWIDKDNLLPGQKWEDEINNAINMSDFVIVFLSNASISKKGYVQREFKLALETMELMPEGRIFLLPLKLDDCDLPTKFKHLHWVNLFDEEGFEKVVKAINTLSGLEKSFK